MRLRGGRIEVGYRDGRRYVFRTVPSPLRTEGASAVRSASRDWVVLASGGARGITAELLRDLAKAGVTLVITGRTPEPPDEDEATRKLTTDAELKAHLIREARAAGEEVRPVEVQRKLGRLRNEREMRANLSDLRAAGATIDYRVCDMADPDATAELFAALYRDYGRLDGVVHGAGIIEDKLLVDKTPQSWFRVFDIKADSAFLLARHLRPDTLRFVTLFTSVAGRYGNSGQTDYAAANEVVNRAAWSLQRRFGDAVKVSAINWGPWAATRHGQGMVSAEAERKFAARGVHLVYPQAGRELFMHEITTAPTHEVEVIAGSGPWEQVESDYGRLAEGLAIDPPVAAARRPLLAQAAFRTGTEDRRVASRTVRLSSDLYLDQHLINSTPVMPAAVAVEMMAQAALSYCPDYVITEMSDIRLFNGIRFTSDEIAIAIVANIGTVGADDDRIAVDLALYPAGAKGRPSYRATAHLNGAPLKRPVYQSLLKPAGSPLSAREAYQRVLFHGPCFQNIEELRGLDRQGAVCGLKRTPPMDLWLSAPPDGAEWLFDPGCLDAAAQLGVVYGNVLNGESALPNSFARVRRFGDAPIPACTMYFLAHPEQPEHRIRADVAFVDDEGKLRLFVEQLECTSSEALNSIGGGWKGRISV
ncbi:MAG: SDR family NAD(P)-dependent oxidoreductase [Pseudomonadota bacterium]